MDLVEILEAGRRDFIDATRGVSPVQASARPSPLCWSVLECIEHVVAFEARYLQWIANVPEIPSRCDHAREARLFTMIRSRQAKRNAPEALRPQGRFRSLDAALSEFHAIRDRSIHLVRERGGTLYCFGIRHPYFGNVNGAELIHLIDGHTRRHADQIREILEAPASLESPMKSARPKKPGAFKRDQPDLPAEFEPAGNDNDLFAGNDVITIQERHLKDLHQPDLRVDALRIEGSVLERVQLAGGQFGSAVWKDVRLVGCDLANIRARRLTLVRVELIDCRLTGFTTTALDWQDVLIQNGDVRYAQLHGSVFRTCEFEGCNWQEADLQNADLAGSVFRSCQLARADLRGAKLQNTDFRKSEVEGMLVEMADLRGAIVDPAQAMVFARVLGLQIL